MASLEEKKALILKQEEQFARTLANGVIERPPLSFWMILIPILFVFFFIRCQKVFKGRQEFARHYLISRGRALDMAAASIETGESPDIERLCQMSTAPAQTHGQYREWMRVLFEHYADLIRSEGDDFQSLIRSAYRTKTNCLLGFNRLNQAERGFMKALRPHLQGEGKNMDDTIERIDRTTVFLRKKMAEIVFP